MAVDGVSDGLPDEGTELGEEEEGFREEGLGEEGDPEGRDGTPVGLHDGFRDG